MSEKIVVPVLGESITEATVAKWLKNAGDAVEADEPIVELETDKVNLEVPSPVKGVLTEITSKDGSVVEVGALLGTVSENKSDGDSKIKEIKKILFFFANLFMITPYNYLKKPDQEGSLTSPEVAGNLNFAPLNVTPASIP